MFNLFGTVIDATAWFFTTGWKVWSSLFAAFPYGDPYVAIVAALLVGYTALKIVSPDSRRF